MRLPLEASLVCDMEGLFGRAPAPPKTAPAPALLVEWLLWWSWSHFGKHLANGFTSWIEIVKSQNWPCLHFFFFLLSFLFFIFFSSPFFLLSLFLFSSPFLFPSSPPYPFHPHLLARSLLLRIRIAPP
jgi:hypothetical protein